MKTLLTLLLFALPAAAQDTVTVGTPLALLWEQDAATLAEAQSYSYKLYISPAADTILTNVTCAVTATAGVFTCQAPMFALTVGVFTMHLTAILDGLESDQSSPVYTLTIVESRKKPRPPRGVRAGQQ